MSRNRKVILFDPHFSCRDQRRERLQAASHSRASDTRVTFHVPSGYYGFSRPTDGQGKMNSLQHMTEAIKGRLFDKYPFVNPYD